MKKFLSGLVFFLLYASMIYATVLFACGNLLPRTLTPNLKYPIGSRGHLYSRLKEVKTTEKVDILFLGSSHAIRSFNTQDIARAGYSSFNLGCRAGTPKQALPLLHRYIDQLDPKLVVLEVFPLTFELDGIESALHLLANDVKDRHALEMTLDYNHIKVYNTFIYGSMRELFGLDENYYENPLKGKDKYFLGGYVERQGQYWSPVAFEDHILNYDVNQIKAFEQIIDLLKSRDIKVALVFAPISPTYYSSFKDIDTFDALMSDHAEYYNYNDMISLNDSLHFYDKHHLNKEGVDKFTPIIVDMLGDQNILKN